MEKSLQNIREAFRDVEEAQARVTAGREAVLKLEAEVEQLHADIRQLQSAQVEAANQAPNPATDLQAFVSNIKLLEANPLLDAAIREQACTKFAGGMPQVLEFMAHMAEWAATAAANVQQNTARQATPQPQQPQQAQQQTAATQLQQ